MSIRNIIATAFGALGTSIFLSTGLGLTACNQNLQTLNAASDSTAVANPTWNGQIRTIIQNNCTVCHNHSDFSDSTKVWRERSHISDEVKSGDMPPYGPLSLKDQQELLHWLSDTGMVIGSPDTTQAAVTGGNITVANIAPIISQNCISCHSSQQPILSTNALIIKNGSLIVSAVSSGSMPQGGHLSTAQIQLLTQWQNGGFQ